MYINTNICICNTNPIVGKAETSFNVRLNNHRKDVKDPKAIPADKHFNQTDIALTYTLNSS